MSAPRLPQGPSDRIPDSLNKKVAVTLSWDSETVTMVEDLQQQFSLFVNNRSQVIRLVVKLVHQIVLRNGVQSVVADYLSTSQHLEQRAGHRDVNTER